jgi:ketol-acid reductoisomerase
MTKVFTENDVNPTVLKDSVVAILGYGSQGRAHAMNLRDSGLDVRLGLRAGGKSYARAEADGWEPVSFGEAVVGADLVVFLTPDLAQPKMYEEAVKGNLKPGAALVFAHGFNVHYGYIKPEEGHDVFLVAPKSPGDLVRRQFEEGKGVPCLAAVYQDASGEAFDKALAYAHFLGGSRAGIMKTNFAEETETDLFGEQAVLCGGVTELIKAGFDTLTDAGYQPEVAYFECLHELKLIVDLIYEGGFAKMHDFVSDTAKYGDLTRGPRVVDDHVRKEMKAILEEVQDGRFAREWMDEYNKGMSHYRKMQEEDLAHPIESVGSKLRHRMAWLRPSLKEAP